MMTSSIILDDLTLSAMSSTKGLSMTFAFGITVSRLEGVADRFAHSPRLSDNALETWDKILETVFMAFLATTLGTMIALPLSFLAARNLMKDAGEYDYLGEFIPTEVQETYGAPVDEA